jgi:hypothetical protein
MKLNREESFIYVLKQIRKLINMAIGEEKESHPLEPGKGTYGNRQNPENINDNGQAASSQSNNCEVCD